MASFFLRRSFSTSARVWRYHSSPPSLAVPAAVGRGAVLETSELQQLAKKANGHWKELSNEEILKLYRASFPVTFKEMRAGHGDYKKVLPAVIIMSLFGAWLANFLRDTVGPTVPHTYKNKDWEEATKEKLIRQKANPIEGISSMNKA